MSTFIKGLGLDLFDFKDKLITITEENLAEASFCLSCIMWQAFSNSETGVCLVALHQSLRHYYHVGMRLGYNLSRNYGERFVAVDAVDIREAHAKERKETELSPKILYSIMQQKVISLKKKCKNVFIIIDDISDFMNLGVHVNEVLLFIQYLLNGYLSNCTIVIGMHCNEEDEEQLKINNTLCYSADLKIVTRSLETGFSKEVTGSVEVTKVNEDSLGGWSHPVLYHYKTKERNIDVFLPGNISFSY